MTPERAPWPGRPTAPPAVPLSKTRAGSTLARFPRGLPRTSLLGFLGLSRISTVLGITRNHQELFENYIGITHILGFQQKDPADPIDSWRAIRRIP